VILLLNRDLAYIKDFLFRRETDSTIPYSEDRLYFLPFHVARAFVERQWEFRPIIFEYGEIHRTVGDYEILPFLEEDKGCEGGFGIVWTVKIHASAQKLVISSLETVVIAQKELRETDSGNERTILELLRHPNIVRVFGSYTHHGVHNPSLPLRVNEPGRAVPANVDYRFLCGHFRNIRPI
jgi:serine/threonine protein kinase